MPLLCSVPQQGAVGEGVGRGVGPIIPRAPMARGVMGRGVAGGVAGGVGRGVAPGVAGIVGPRPRPGVGSGVEQWLVRWRFHREVGSGGIPLWCSVPQQKVQWQVGWGVEWHVHRWHQE
jgi:hypothetical protein